CGRPGTATCCVTNSRGKTSCRVKKPPQCFPPTGGHACVSYFSSCCDSCSATGCIATPTPTPPPTPTPSPPPTPTPPPIPTPTPPAVARALVGLPALPSVPSTPPPGTSKCGGPRFTPPAATPFAGEADDANGNKLADLGAGCLYASNLPPQMILPGGTALLD